MCRIEDITNFHGSLTFDMFKMFQYFESPSYAYVVKWLLFLYLCFHGNVIRPRLHLGMSQNVQN